MVNTKKVSQRARVAALPSSQAKSGCCLSLETEKSIGDFESAVAQARKEMCGRSPLIFLASAAMLLCLSAAPLAGALRFDLQSGQTKCISEDIKVGAMAVGKYTVINPSEGHPLPDSHKITVRVTSPYGNNIHFADHADSGNFAFTSSEAGDYLACFWTPDHKPPVPVTLEFEWRTGVAAKDWTSVAKKNQIDVMELELKKLEDTVKSIHDEMFYLREREEEMQDMNRTTNSRMAWLSFLSLAVCLSVAGMQLWHLKTFFERKKLL